jgi:AcrR family transcriptional regulator
MARGSRIRLDLDSRRAQLLELGRALFNARAYDDISIDDIAAAAGVSKGLLYHYFPSKRSFYVATVREGVARLLERTETGPDVPPSERLTRGLDAYLAYVEENASAYAGLLRSGVGRDDEVAEIVEETRRKMIARIAGGLGIDDPPPHVAIALRGWIGMVEGASLEWVERGGVARSWLRDMLVRALESTLAHALTLPVHHDAGPSPVRASRDAASRASATVAVPGVAGARASRARVRRPRQRPAR